MEQAIIVHFLYGSAALNRLFVLEDRLKKAITAAKVGEYDGNEVAVDGSNGSLYMYGPDADRLFEVIVPVLRTADFIEGTQVTRRYGPPEPGVQEVTSTIETNKP